VVDGNGLPLATTVSPGQSHESKWLEPTLLAVRIPQSRAGRPRRWPDAVAADRAYSFHRVRSWLHRRSVEPVIPQRSNQVGRKGGCRRFDKEKYRGRNVVERCVAWLKICRRVLTRFEKLAVNYLAMLQLSCIQRYLRVLAPH